MSAEEIEKIREDAWTFGELEPPPGSVLIGSVVRNGETYYYYKNGDNDPEKPYLFETESGYIFKKKMAAIGKKTGNEKGLITCQRIHEKDSKN